MKNNIESAVSKIQRYWRSPEMSSVSGIRSVMETLARDLKVRDLLQDRLRGVSNALELHRDQENGFILLAYSESQGHYRIPHDHGEAWVAYAVASGEVEMGSYFKFGLPNGQHRLILKEREKLSSGETRIYFPGEIHDTRCLSEDAVILRLTSADLKEEERLGRMHRYPL